MAVTYHSVDLEWILAGFTIHRMVTEDAPVLRSVADVTISVGEKVRDDQGNVLLGPSGAELWREWTSKSFSLSEGDLAQFLAEHAAHGALWPYHVSAPDLSAGLGLAQLDGLQSGAPYQLARWMVDRGAWRLT